MCCTLLPTLLVTCQSSHMSCAAGCSRNHVTDLLPICAVSISRKIVGSLSALTTHQMGHSSEPDRDQYAHMQAATQQVPKYERLGPDAFILRNVLTSEECDQWVAAAEQAQFLEHGQIAPHNGEPAYFAGDRKRATLFNAEMADTVYRRLKPHLREREHNERTGKEFSFAPQSVYVRDGAYEPCSVSPLMRFSKYEPGQSFAWHVDTVTALDRLHVGLDTILVYLNDGFEGGATALKDYDHQVTRGHDSPRKYTVVPEKGMALVFYHFQMHAGEPVKSGRKLVVRTEVEYRQKVAGGVLNVADLHRPDSNLA